MSILHDLITCKSFNPAVIHAVVPPCDISLNLYKIG